MLWGHSQDDSIRRAMPLIARLKPASWVALDPPGDVAHDLAAQGVTVIARRHYKYDFGTDAVREDISRGVTPIVAATEFVRSCENQSWWRYVKVIMVPPAMISDGTDPMTRSWAVQFQGWIYALLRDQRRDTVVCNVSTGNSGYFVPAPPSSGYPHPTMYGCQEYFWTPGVSDLLKYRTWFPQRVLSRQPNATLWVLECGATALQGRPIPAADGSAPHGSDVGWRGGHGISDLGLSILCAALSQYHRSARQDPYVKGLYYYQLGGNDDWATHEGLDDLNEWLITENEEVELVGPELKASHSKSFEEWWKAGGWRNFAAFLVATGQISATDAQRRDLVLDRLTSATEETKLFLNNLPLA